MKRNVKIFVFSTILLILIASLGIFFMFAFFSPTNVAQTSENHPETALRTRRYKFSGDLTEMRTQIEQIIPSLRTSIWGGNWKLAEKQAADLSAEKQIIRAAVPVAIFTDDLWIELRRDGNEVVANAHSNSRVGKSDFGENRRHLLQILQKLDEQFGNANF